MGKTLTNWVVDSILSEDIKKEVVVYSGRFQPFHSGHAKVYEHLVSKFGKNNVFIGTSKKQGGPRHPFNFREKREVMTYKHEGFWECADTVRDVNHLNKIWNNNEAKWKVWK